MMHTELQQRINLNNIHRYTASGGHQWRIVNDRSGKTYKPSKQRKLILYDTLYGSEFRSARVHGSQELAFPHAEHGVAENVRVKEVNLGPVVFRKCRGSRGLFFELIHGLLDCAVHIQAKPIEAHFANGFVRGFVKKPLVEIGDQFVLKRTPTHSGALWTVLGNSFGSALGCFKDGIQLS